MKDNRRNMTGRRGGGGGREGDEEEGGGKGGYISDWPVMALQGTLGRYNSDSASHEAL